jgi:hypothetical protein
VRDELELESPRDEPVLWRRPEPEEDQGPVLPFRRRAGNDDRGPGGEPPPTLH